MMMKTPEEIKKGLECCRCGKGCTDECPYVSRRCELDLLDDALAYIIDLEQRLAQVKRERDAAVRIVHGLCLHCKNDGSEDREKCRECMYNPHRVLFSTKDKYNDNWEWRGVRAENSKEENE